MELRYVNMKFNYEKIPYEIKQLKRWVLWKIRKLENGKTTKIPINANNGYGAKSNDEIDHMLKSFATFDLLHTDEYDFEGVGFILKTLRENGVTVPLTDVMIAFCAMKYDVPVWTQDGHFRLIQGLYPELALYNI